MPVGWWITIQVPILCSQIESSTPKNASSLFVRPPLATKLQLQIWITPKINSLKNDCKTGWWFQPIWKILYSQTENLPQEGGKIKNCLKPPPWKRSFRSAHLDHLSYRIICWILQVQIVSPPTVFKPRFWSWRSNGKKRALLSVKYWLFTRDP